jgi:hypothetical protein
MGIEKGICKVWFRMDVQGGIHTIHMKNSMMRREQLKDPKVI